MQRALGRPVVELRGSDAVVAAGRTFVNERVFLCAGSARAFETRLIGCTFEGCELESWTARRVTLHDVVFRNCQTRRGPLLLDLCVLVHVRFEGTIGDVLVNRALDLEPAEVRDELRAAHAGVDWAIDVSRCRPHSFQTSELFPFNKVRLGPDQVWSPTGRLLTVPTDRMPR